MWDKINYIYKMTWMIKLTRVDFGVEFLCWWNRVKFEHKSEQLWVVSRFKNLWFSNELTNCISEMSKSIGKSKKAKDKLAHDLFVQRVKKSYQINLENQKLRRKVAQLQRKEGETRYENEKLQSQINMICHQGDELFEKMVYERIKDLVMKNQELQSKVMRLQSDMKKSTVM